MSRDLAKIMGDALQTFTEKAAGDGAKAVSGCFQNVEKGVRKAATNHAETDATHASELRSVGDGGHSYNLRPRPPKRGPDEDGGQPSKRPNGGDGGPVSLPLRPKPQGGRTPVYHVGDDGTIRRLNDDRTKTDLDGADRSRLGIANQHLGQPRPGEAQALLNPRPGHNAPPRPQTQSTRVGHNNPLARATNLARHSDNSYGSARARRGLSAANNYAAARVNGADGSGDFILVGRSNRIHGFTHSERMVGIPFLRQNQAGRISDLYTERAPCTDGVNCSAWLAERFPNTLRVSHSFDGGGAQTQTMGQYLTQLRASR